MTTWLDTSQMRYRIVDGLSIRFAESEGDQERSDALLLSPWPESLLAFEPTWALCKGASSRHNDPRSLISAHAGSSAMMPFTLPRRRST